MNVLTRNNVKVIGNEASKEVLVLAHGFGTDQTSYAEIVPHFTKRYKIILYDNVGGGKSDANSFSFNKYNTLLGYVSDLAELLHALNVEKVNFVGHSVSGMIGTLTSIYHPELIDKLILLGASPRYLNDPANDYVGGFNQEDLDQLYQFMSTNYYAWTSGFSKLAMGNPERPHLADSFAGTLQELRPDIALSVAKVIFESDYRHELCNCKAKTLVVQTKEDIAVPLNVGDYLHQNIKNSDFTIIDATGHFPHISAPNEVTKIVQSYLN